MSVNERMIEEIVKSVITSLDNGGAYRDVPTGKPCGCNSCPLSNPRQRMLEVGQLIYDRRLSDAAGGNLSCRVGDKIYITPRYMGEKHRYKIIADDIILADLNGSIYEGEANMVSREGNLHFGIYRRFPEINAVIHAHPRNILPFATTGVNIPPITDMLVHFNIGDVECCAPADPASDELANNVIKVLENKRNAMKEFGAAVMIPKHGILVVGVDLDYAYAILESIDTAAYVYIESMHLKNTSLRF